MRSLWMMVEFVVLAGTPADCVSLAFTGEIFPWRKPTLVTYSLPTQHMFLKLCCSVSSVVTYWYFLLLCIRFNGKLMSYWSVSIGRAQVVSGINKGSNCGYHTYGCFICVPHYSTTRSWTVIIASHCSRVHTQVVKKRTCILHYWLHENNSQVFLNGNWCACACMEDFLNMSSLLFSLM